MTAAGPDAWRGTAGRSREGAVPRLVLLGPAAAGKSTLGRLLAAGLGCRFVDLDEVAAPLYDEAGWSIQRLVERTAQVGRVAAEREWEPARLHALRRAGGLYPGTVLALGAGHGSYRDPFHRRQAALALADVEHVLLVLPSTRRVQALQVLRARAVATKGTDWISSGHDFLAEWLDDPGTRDLATSVIITAGQAPQATASGILRWLEA